MTFNKLLWWLKYHVRNFVKFLLNLALIHVPLEIVSHFLDALHYFTKIKLFLHILYEKVLWESIVNYIIC